MFRIAAVTIVSLTASLAAVMTKRLFVMLTFALNFTRISPGLKLSGLRVGSLVGWWVKKQGPFWQHLPQYSSEVPQYW